MSIQANITVFGMSNSVNDSETSRILWKYFPSQDVGHFDIITGGVTYGRL